MKKALAVLVCTAVSLAAASGSALAQTNVVDSVTGSVRLFTPNVGGVEESYNAGGGPSGERPGGLVVRSLAFPAARIPFDVTCLAVTGNRAVIGLSHFSRPLGFVSFYRLVVDGGLGGQDMFGQAGAVDTPADCATVPIAADPSLFQFVSGDVVVADDAQGSPQRMVGKGTVTSTGGGGTAAYAYILRCSGPNPNDVFEVRGEFAGFAGARFRLTSTNSVSCTDDPAVATPAAGLDTMTGAGVGTLSGVPLGGRSTIQFRFVDGGTGGANDSAQLTIAVGGLTVFQGTAKPPGRFPGSDQATGNNTAQTR